MNQRGYIKIILVVLVIVLVGVVGYLTLGKKFTGQENLLEQPQSQNESTTIPETIAYRDEIAGIGFERPNESIGLTSELAGIVENGTPRGLTISDVDVAARRYAGKYFGFPNGLPSGTNVSLSPLTINGQEARLISGEEPQQYFVLFVKLPKIVVNRWVNQYSYYAFLSSDKKYLDAVIPTITFFNPVKDEEKICSTAPKFEQYQIDSVFSGVPKVDFSLDVWNRYQAKDPVSEASAVKAKDKPDFAGYYIIVSSGCGTSCLSIGAVDLRTGAAYAVIGTNGSGINYKLNSRLFSYSSDNQIRYYLWENNSSKLLCVTSIY